MGKKSPSVPPPPDPAKTIAAQATANKEALTESARINAVNLFGPQGTTTYGLRDDGTPHSQYTDLGPQGQYLYDAQQAIAGELMQQAYDRVGQIPKEAFSLSHLPYSPTSYDTSQYKTFQPVSYPVNMGDADTSFPQPNGAGQGSFFPQPQPAQPGGAKAAGAQSPAAQPPAAGAPPAGAPPTSVPSVPPPGAAPGAAPAPPPLSSIPMPTPLAPSKPQMPGTPGHDQQWAANQEFRDAARLASEQQAAAWAAAHPPKPPPLTKKEKRAQLLAGAAGAPSAAPGSSNYLPNKSAGATGAPSDLPPPPQPTQRTKK
jgi:hypothetical protein